MKTGELGESSGLLRRAAGGDAEAVRSLLDGQRGRLRRLVRLRLSRELSGRLDEARVVDEILAEAEGRIAAFAESPSRPLALWVRDLACRKLAELHGGTSGPGAVGELTLHRGGLPIADPARLAAAILGTADPRGDDRAGRRVFLQEALNSLEALDRELIALKHFERLGFGEIAQVLGLSESEAGRRYLGAIRRLREVLPWDDGPRHS